MQVEVDEPGASRAQVTGDHTDLDRAVPAEHERELPGGQNGGDAGRRLLRHPATTASRFCARGRSRSGASARQRTVAMVDHAETGSGQTRDESPGGAERGGALLLPRRIGAGTRPVHR